MPPTQQERTLFERLWKALWEPMCVNMTEKELRAYTQQVFELGRTFPIVYEEPDAPKLYTYQEAQWQLGISETAFYQAIQRLKIRGQKSVITSSQFDCLADLIKELRMRRNTA